MKIECFENIKLYRRRYKPLEIVYLKDDKILYLDDNILITKWNVLKPRSDISGGHSCYYIKEGFKVSRFVSTENQFLYWYCDIIETVYNEESCEYTFNDLLIDVIIDTHGSVKVVDMADVADALVEGNITQKQATDALYSCDKLLHIIYSGKFNSITTMLRDYI